jgi:cytochrome c peroxidase
MFGSSTPLRLAVLLAGIGIVGCDKSGDKPAMLGGPAPKEEPITPSSAELADAEHKSTAAKASPGPELMAKSDSKQPAPAQPSKSGKKVMLGSPELYAGIPGEGDLTLEQIRKWLDDPKNHEELEVELPLGLSTGQSQMKGLDKNPLTRAKIELGRQMYFDGRLSKDTSISCASCHDPDEGFATHTQFGIGVRKQQGGRNSPVAYNRILSDNQFWDGRAASLEDQAKGPIANPIEMDNTHEECEKCIEAIDGYRLQFEKIFGKVSIDSVAKAIASFERTLVSGPTPFDYYVRWDAYKDVDPDELKDDPDQLADYNRAKSDAEKHPMSESAKRGHAMFFGEKASCSACHVGANLSDEKYHNLGIGMDKNEPDLGRYAETKQDVDKGAFKTPTCRNVTLSAPYMHDGSIKTLEEVIDWYDKGGHPNAHLDPKIKKLNLTKQDKDDLLAFLKACTDPFPKIERERLPK